MKRLRLLSIVLFVITAVGFTIFQMKQMNQTDRLAPLISIEERVKKISVKDGEKKLLEGVSASDTKDGDVTSSLVVEGLSAFLGDHRRLVSYAAFDSDNHVTRDSREVIYTDYTSPKFELEEPLKFPVGMTNFLENMKVKDCLDGDLSSKIKISPDSSVTVDMEGEYNVRFQAANSAGEVVYLPVTVQLYEYGTYSQTPKIQLKEYIVYTTREKKINPFSYLKSVVLGNMEYEFTDGEETYGEEGIGAADIEKWTINRSRIRVIDPVDYEKTGTYEIIYSMTTEEGVTGNVRLIVVVEEQKGESRKDVREK